MSAFLELGRESSSLVGVSACLNAGHRPAGKVAGRAEVRAAVATLPPRKIHATHPHAAQQTSSPPVP